MIKTKNITHHRRRWRVRIAGIVDTEFADSVYGKRGGYKAAVALRNKLYPGYRRHEGWTKIEGLHTRRCGIYDTYSWVVVLDRKNICQASILKHGYQGAFNKVRRALCKAQGKDYRKKQASYPVPDDLRAWLKWNAIEFPKKL